MNNTINEYKTNAEIAMNNRQFEVALTWYKKALAEEPTDLYVLSRAGAACVQLKLFDDALGYFSKAVELDPENGDNYFNLANAYFFMDNVSKAFELYVDAERIGCSNDVALQLNYQLMLLCSFRGDIKSALIYIKKCESLDKTGTVALNPDFISEKVKLYMLDKDYDSAEKCAAQLVAIDPSNYRSQSIYYSLLMAADKFDKAMQVINDIENYVDLDSDEEITLAAQKSALYIIMAEAGKGSTAENYRLAEGILEAKLKERLTVAQRNLLSVTLAELYYKSEKYDAAIELSEGLLPDSEYAVEEKPTDIGEDDIDEKANRAQAEKELADNIRAIERSGVRIEPQKVRGANGKIEYAFKEEDLERISKRLGNEKRTADEAEDALSEIEPIELDQLEKVYFVLISSYMAKDDYAKASKYASLLKHSENKYYSYFGLYIETLASKYLLENEQEIELKYAKAVAFFKNKMLLDYTDSLAALFRVRLYAESGRFEKAEELAAILSDDDKKAALDYIREWQSKQ